MCFIERLCNIAGNRNLFCNKTSGDNSLAEFVAKIKILLKLPKHALNCVYLIACLFKIITKFEDKKCLAKDTLPFHINSVFELFKALTVAVGMVFLALFCSFLLIISPRMQLKVQIFAEARKTKLWDFNLFNVY